MVNQMSSTTHNKRPFLLSNVIDTQNAGIEAALRESIYLAAHMFERVRAGIARRIATRAAYEELSQMSDRELADIGIARNKIRAVVTGKYARRG